VANQLLLLEQNELPVALDRHLSINKKKRGLDEWMVSGPRVSIAYSKMSETWVGINFRLKGLKAAIKVQLEMKLQKQKEEEASIELSAGLG
jgi:hypothetical protein